MKLGRVSETIFNRSVLKRITSKRSEVLKSVKGGEYCAFLRFDENSDVVISEDFVADKALGNEENLLIRINNRLAAKGATPVAVDASVILNEDSEETKLREIVDNIEKIAKAADMQILNVNTKAARAVTSPVVTMTVTGTLTKNKTEVLSKKVCPGDDVIITKWVGLEGTALLANSDEENLIKKYPSHMIYDAKNFNKLLSVVPEAATAIKSGVTAMHSLSEGGVFAGLWELAQSQGVGLEIDLKKIPIKQETVEISNYYDINPYELLSGGSLLITAKDGNRTIMDLEAIGVEAVIIGKCTDSNDRVLINDDIRRFLEPAKQDAIYKVLV